MSPDDEARSAKPPGELGEEQAACWTRLAARLSSAMSLLPDKPDETMESTLRALWHLAAGKALSADAAMDQPLTTLDPLAAQSLEVLVQERIDGKPLAHMTGRQRFMGLEMIAGPQALIPRRESELLARASIDVLPVATGQPLVAIDVCTGSANIACALAHARTDLTVHGSDLSADAIALASANVKLLGLDRRVQLHVGDLFEPLIAAGLQHGAVLVTCNPPYISSGRVSRMPQEIVGHEPLLAFDGGPFGIGILRRTIRDATGLLAPGGWLLMEVGLGQGPAVMQTLGQNPGYRRISGLNDADGNVRVVKAQFAAE